MKTEKKSHLHTLGEQELEKVTGGIYPSIPQSGSGDTSWDSATGGSGAVQPKTKTCPKCGKEIPEAQYAHHVFRCKTSTGTTK